MSYHYAFPVPSDDDDISKSLRELVDCTSDCLFILDKGWQFTYVSRGAQREIAPDGKRLIGRSIWKAFPEAVGTTIEFHYRRVMETREEAHFEAYFYPLAATYQIHVTPMRTGGIGVSFRNINERVEQTDALILAEERFRLAAEATQDVMFDWDIAKDKLEWLKAHNKSLGHKLVQFAGTVRWPRSIHPDDQKRVRKEVRLAVAGKDRRFDCNFRMMKDDRSYADVLLKAFIARDTNGDATRMVGAIQDTTERTAAARALKDREARLSAILGQAMVGILHRAPSGELMMANDSYCQMMGRTKEELQELSYVDYTHPDDVKGSKSLFKKQLKAKEPFQVEKRYLRPDGSVVWCEVNVSFLKTETGEVDGTIVVTQDISSRKVAEESLRESEMLYRSVLEASTDCIEVINSDGTVHLVNSCVLAARGLAEVEDARGKPWVHFWPKQSHKDVRDAMARASDGKSFRFSTNSAPPSADPRWWDVVVSPMCDEHGQVTRLLSIARDTTIQRETAAQLEWASEHDSLTELPNRRAFKARLQAATLRAMETGGKVGLLLIDLDHFKHVNDTLGHPAGDHLLVVFAGRLMRSLRKGDFVARLGGDEFAILVENAAEESDLTEMGRTILSRLQNPVHYEGRVMSASASIGGAVFPNDAHNANDFFDNADIALYSLKATGRGGTKMFEPRMRDQAQIVSSQLNVARVSLTADSIVPHYQQKVDLGTGAIVGFEALLRWQDSVHGIQNPATVAEAFNDYELASKISDLMQERVFRDVRGWLNRNLPFGLVSINAAPVEFLRDDFAERMILRIQQHGIPPELIELEVTEYVFLERSSDYVGRALRQLSKAGVRIALDDFGTGYSSLSHLRDFPVDVVKIDRSFIEKIAFDPEITAIVSAVIGLAGSLNMKVVAEGVETEEQLGCLQDQGCPFGQGFYFGKPVEAAEVSRLLDARQSHKFRERSRLYSSG